MFYIKIKNFKAYQESDWIKLAPVTLIYGVNSSGKSAIVQSCRIISSLLGAIRRSTAVFDSRRSSMRKSHNSGFKRSPLTIPLSGPDETGQIFDFGDYQQVVFGQDSKKAMAFAIRYSPNKDLDQAIRPTDFRIPAHIFEHKLEATLGQVPHDPISAKINRLTFGFKSAPLGPFLWRSIFEEEHPNHLDEIEHRYEENAWKKIKELIPKGIDKITLPLVEVDLEAVDSEEFDIPRHRGRTETQVFEIAEASITSIQKTLEPFIKEFFPDKISWFKPNNRFFISFSAGYGIYCVDKRNNEQIEKRSDNLWSDFPEELEIEDDHPSQPRKNRKIKLRTVISPQDHMWQDPEDAPLEEAYDEGFIIAQLIRSLCLQSIRLYDAKFGTTNHIPGFRGQPARYEGALDNRNSPLSASLAFLAEDRGALDLVLHDLKTLGISIAANPQSARFAGARLDSFDFKPGGKDEIILTLVDMGFGISQIIPILAAIRQSTSKGRTRLSHILVEEPEAHLHPSLQGNLMEHFAMNSRSRVPEAFEELEKEDPPSALLERHDFVIETHSENLVTRLQKLINQGKVNNQHVSVVFCSQIDGSARIDEIEIGADGRLLDPWPNDFVESRFDAFKG